MLSMRESDNLINLLAQLTLQDKIKVFELYNDSYQYK